jgi:probable HAF family extracellular repeat protein
MKRDALGYLVFTLLLCFGEAAHAVTTYQITSLPVLQSPYAVTLNSQGQFLEEVLDNSLFHPLLGYQYTTVDLGVGPNNDDNGGHAINNVGQVAGYLGDYGPYGLSNGSMTNRAYLWTPSSPNGLTGSRVDLGLLTAPLETGATALGINDLGQVVGFGSSLFSSQHAFLWSPTTPNGTSGSMVGLDNLPANGNGLSRALDINSGGQVAGTYGLNGSGSHAFLWKPVTPNGTTGSMIDLGDLAGGAENSIAYAINSRGQVVGSGETALGPSAFLWNPTSPNATTGTLIDIGESLGSLYSDARDVNAAGQVVGRGHLNGSSNDLAFIWNPTTPNGATGTVSDLNSLIDDPFWQARWRLTEATAINDRGEIVGFGAYDGYGFDSDPFGPLSPFVTYEAFLLTPIQVPEPGVLTLAVAGIAFGGAYSPRRRFIGRMFSREAVG